MLNSISPKRKLFYIWDLEWLRPHAKDFIANLRIYRHPKLELIARSISHAQAVENYANKKVNAIIPDFNLQYIISYLGAATC